MLGLAPEEVATHRAIVVQVDARATVAQLQGARWNPFTLIPITPTRLAEKQVGRDFFFTTVLSEGRILAAEN